MLVIGNGESRRDFDIDSITETKIGCNALLRDYEVRHLVCVDRKMVNEAIDVGYNKHSFIYTRKDWHKEFENIKNIKIVPDLPYVGSERCDEPIHWGSGPYAVLLACKLVSKLKDPEPVRLIGFDLYGTTEGKVNNIYKSTDNYDLEHKRAVDPRYWIYQISKVFEHHPTIRFEVYQVENWSIPKTWRKRNVSFDNIDNFCYTSKNSSLSEITCLKTKEQNRLLEKQ